MNAPDQGRYEEKRGRWSDLGKSGRSTETYQRPATAVGNIALMFALLALTAGGALALSAAAPGGIQWSSPTQGPESANGLAFQVDVTATADVLQAELRATLNASSSTQSAGAAQAELDAKRLQAEQTATADILQAQLRATANAAALTHSVAQTQVQTDAEDLRAQQTATADILQVQLRATANAAASTQSAAATQTQQPIDADAAVIGTAVAGTATAVSQAIAAETQAAAATAQRRADQAQADAAEQARTVAFWWNWGPTLLVIALLGSGAWAFWRWEIRRRAPPAPTFEPRPPEAPPIRQPLEALPEPDQRPRQYPQLATSNDPVSGWLAEIKRRLLPGGKDHDDRSNP